VSPAATAKAEVEVDFDLDLELDLETAPVTIPTRSQVCLNAHDSSSTG
jgi:hypothetical protein